MTPAGDQQPDPSHHVEIEGLEYQSRLDVLRSGKVPTGNRKWAVERSRGRRRGTEESNAVNQVGGE